MNPEQIGILNEYLAQHLPTRIVVPTCGAQVADLLPLLDVDEDPDLQAMELYQDDRLVQRVTWPL